MNALCGIIISTEIILLKVYDYNNITIRTDKLPLNAPQW